MEFTRVGLVIILILLNAFFVASEYALIAVRKTQIDVLAKKGSKRAKLVQKSISNLTTFISATQLGVTIVSLALGWIGEPTVERILEPLFHALLPADIAIVSTNGIVIVLAFIIITFFQIIFGELMPKTIALQKAETTTLVTILPLLVFTNIFRPFVWMLNLVGSFCLRVIGFSQALQRQSVHSEEEIELILAQSAKQGAIEKKEAEMAHSVLRFGDVPVRQIMIRRSEIIGFEKNTPLDKVISITQKNPHSRFPVYEKSLDAIIGFIHIKDMYRNLLIQTPLVSLKELYIRFLRKNEKRTLAQLRITRKIPHLSATERIDDVLRTMQREQVHIAVVANKQGKTIGIVTLEDILENIVGEIEDEFEQLKKIDA